MNKLFVDANVLVAVINKEYPVFSKAIRVLSLADHPQFQLFTSPLALAIAFYFAEKKSGTKSALSKIRLLQEKLHIASCGKSEVEATVQNKKVLDFEDGLQFYAAKHAGCTMIITEDTADFHFADIPVLNSEDCLRHHIWVVKEK